MSIRVSKMQNQSITLPRTFPRTKLENRGKMRTIQANLLLKFSLNLLSYSNQEKLRKISILRLTRRGPQVQVLYCPPNISGTYG